MTAVAVTFVTPNPSPAGTVFRVSAVATGGALPHQFKYVTRSSDGTALTSRNWSQDPTFAAQITSAGQFKWEVWGRSGNNFQDAPEATTTFELVATQAPRTGALTGISVSVDVPDGRPAGQPVTFTGHPIGGDQPAQLKWLVGNVVAQEWSTSLTFTWTPTVVGTHEITVWGRSLGATADAAQASQTFSRHVTSPRPTPWMTAVRATNLRQTRNGAQTVLSFDLAGEGGVPPYSFRIFHRFGAGFPQLVRSFSEETSFSFTVAEPGAHNFDLEGRSAGSQVVEIQGGAGFHVQ